MRDSVKARSDISFENPLRPVISTEGNEAGFNRIRRAAASPKSVRVRISRCFRDWIKRQQVQGLHGSISHGRDREGPFRTIAFGVNLSEGVTPFARLQNRT